MKKIILTTSLLVLMVSVALARLGSSRVTPQTLSQHGILFAVTAQEKDELLHFSVTLTPQKPRDTLPTNLVGTLTIHDEEQFVFGGQLCPRKHDTSQIYSFSISLKSATLSQLVLDYSFSPPKTSVVMGHIYTIVLGDFIEKTK